MQVKIGTAFPEARGLTPDQAATVLQRNFRRMHEEGKAERAGRSAYSSFSLHFSLFVSLSAFAFVPSPVTATRGRRWTPRRLHTLKGVDIRWVIQNYLVT